MKKPNDKNTELKHHALDVASRTHLGKEDDIIVAAAEKYFDFLRGVKK